MNDDDLINEMVEYLEENGEIRITDGIREVYIQSYDEEGGALYISNNNREFDDAEEAVQWAVDHFGGAENIDEWE